MESKAPSSVEEVKEPYLSDISLNFDYLNFLDDEYDYPDPTARVKTTKKSPRIVDEPAERGPRDMNEGLLNVIDELDARVENFRRDALSLLDMREYLLTSIDLIQETNQYQELETSEREDLSNYIKRVNCRLSTVEINVQTIRDQSQEDSLYQINDLIDLMITINDPFLARQQCQQYLNVCGDSSSNTNSSTDIIKDTSVGLPDKNFESALLGCTLDDQKVIKKRLTALMSYLNKQKIKDDKANSDK